MRPSGINPTNHREQLHPSSSFMCWGDRNLAFLVQFDLGAKDEIKVVDQEYQTAFDRVAHRRPMLVHTTIERTSCGRKANQSIFDHFSSTYQGIEAEEILGAPSLFGLIT